MKKLHYNRLEYTTLSKVSRVAINKVLEKSKKDITDIEKLAWYKFGPYSKQPVIIFFNDGSIYKVNGSLKAEKIR